MAVLTMTSDAWPRLLANVADDIILTNYGHIFMVITRVRVTLLSTQILYRYGIELISNWIVLI